MGGCRGTTDDSMTITHHLFQLWAVLCSSVKNQPCPFPDVNFPPLLLSASLFSSWHCLIGWFLPGLMISSIAHHFSFLHNAKLTVIWPIGCSYSFPDLICDEMFVNALTYLWRSTVKVQDSQVYRKNERTNEHKFHFWCHFKIIRDFN